MKSILVLLCATALLTGCNRNRVGDEKGYVESEATDLSTIHTGTSEKDAQTAGAGSATGPAGETSGGTFGSTGTPVPGTTSSNLPQPKKTQPDKE